jgi:lysozyme
MQTSANGVASLEQEEGVVLRAYLDPVGVWTIGAGLTAASGVVKPKAGMVITRAEASNLLQRALRASYEPAVAAAMPGAKQNEFDAGIGFHWNLGAIGRASWVKAWRAKKPRAEIRSGLLLWNRAGGRVMPALTHRREREAAMLLDGIYPRIASFCPSTTLAYAKWGLSMDPFQIEEVRKGFRQLGYDPGKLEGVVAIEAARKFQSGCGLTSDGIIGRATLSTLQRRLDARSKAVAPAVTAAASVPASTTDYTDQIANLPWAGTALAVIALIWVGWVAFRYRDAIAAEINSLFPRLAALLRSF